MGGWISRRLKRWMGGWVGWDSGWMEWLGVYWDETVEVRMSRKMDRLDGMTNEAISRYTNSQTRQAFH